MPHVTVKSAQRDFPENTRLVLAIEALGVPIGHRCGGKARCTTCRVRFTRGEPDTMTRAEFVKLGLDQGVKKPDYRLSCQILCTHDMEVEALMTLDNQSWSDTGPAPSPHVEPEAQWYTLDELRLELQGGKP
jgi:ferredoxin